jgi:hypothetical protein
MGVRTEGCVTTAETASGQAGAVPGGPAEPGPARPSLLQRMAGMARYGIWVAVAKRSLVDRRFVASVVTGAIGAYALAGVIKNNQARPARRVVHWYNVKGEVHDIKVLHHARQAVKPGQTIGRAIR